MFSYRYSHSCIAMKLNIEIEKLEDVLTSLGNLGDISMPKVTHLE